ncbi:ABC transporter ATP-binding protein [Paenibacillus campi]|uniref:ABC transporter ATP-binding protein n=1 Tax=Paenibacillus campi TaxID=3106031 RepID=UPI002B000364|nr:ABC transporter ATP-binding protein [Paenibacillus sp. SGZ-1009]
MEELTINLKHIQKKYKLYSKPADRLKEALNITKKKYHTEFYALNDVSLSVVKGETLGIIGKNGSGKSTLLKIITGVLTPTNGERSVNGQISALLELGTGFNPEYTGIENIYLNGVTRGFSKKEMNDKLDQIIDFADIGDFIYQPVKTYSSGMFARLAFAVMISFKPEILIVDEALSVGDVFFQQKCNRYMKEEMSGITKILVTHDLSSIANMADRVIVLSKGDIVFEGEPLKGIEFYTKAMHSELFKEKLEDIATNAGVLEIPADWNVINIDSLGGAQDILIKAIKFRVNDEAYKGYVTAGDSFEINMLIESQKDTSELIIGYLVNDKYGNAIFGENTIGSKLELTKLNKNGNYHVKLNLTWPEVQENDYFVTLGLGEGYDEMNHVIQCWAHNVLQVKNIALNSVHAIFNNKIESIAISKL